MTIGPKTKEPNLNSVFCVLNLIKKIYFYIFTINHENIHYSYEFKFLKHKKYVVVNNND